MWLDGLCQLLPALEKTGHLKLLCGIATLQSFALPGLQYGVDNGENFFFRLVRMNMEVPVSGEHCGKAGP